MYENITIWKTHGPTKEVTDLKKLQYEELHDAHFSTHTTATIKPRRLPGHVSGPGEMRHAPHEISVGNLKKKIPLVAWV
jgi:hypothetical protein